jgi:rifampicin phosphotransferase
MTSPAIPAPRPFPVPEEFAFEWPAPEFAAMTFQQDRMHVPFPQTPMSAWFAQRFARGFSAAFRLYSVPMRVDVLRLNTYYYMGVNPAVPPEQIPEYEAKAIGALQTAMGRARIRWENEWLPELQRGWEAWAAHDLAGADDDELAAIARKGAEWFERIWTIHFELLMPVMLGTSLFQETYTELFPDREPLSAFKLVQGYDNKSLEAGREMWLIARDAAGDPKVATLIRETSLPQLWNALGAAPEAASIKERLDRYLDVYGRRSDNVQELASVSWTENPSPALASLKSYVDDPSDPRQMIVDQAREREAFLAETRAALAGFPDAAKGAFEGLLAVAQDFGPIQEDHNFWIDQRGVHEMRQMCLEIGRRLATRGVLATASDVFLLDLDEALDALAGRDSGVKPKLAERQAEMDHFAKIPAPPVVGMDYGPPPDNPVMRAMARFFGGPPPAPTQANEIRGNTGSPGKATGTARVIMSIADSERLEFGDVLVAPTTAPPWTPLFATACAVVTETGGVLSHCAIVAREYGIPAVVGVPGATQLIRDGSRIEVDGDSGTVRLLE